MDRVQNKVNRLMQIETLLLSHPEGLTQSDLARKLGVNRSTILRNLADMRPIISEANGRLYIDRESYVVNLRLTLHEALTIHLASRLMTTRLDRSNPHAASALRKLGVALDKLAPQLSQHLMNSAETFDNHVKRNDPHYLQCLEYVTLAWSKNQKLKLWYRNMEEGRVKEYIFCPYFIETSAIGAAIYTIGRIEPADQMRTFKFERMERVELLPASYSLPKDFDAGVLLQQAWSIWFTETPPEEVRLRFSPRVARRVKETQWHVSQEITEQADGSVLWLARIAEPREMMPWVRGWGSDVEVLAPAWLRNAMIEETKKLCEVYQ